MVLETAFPPDIRVEKEMRALKEGGDKTESRFDFIAHRLLARPFRAEEIQVAQTSLNDLVAHYKAHAEEAKKLIAVGESKPDAKLNPSELAALTMVSNLILNLDEVINKG